MSGPEAVFAAILIVFGGATLLCVGAALWASRRSASEPEAVGEAPPKCCRTAEHSPWCNGRPVVASEDLTWQVDLAKIYRDYDTYRTELRLPGERAS